MRISKDFYIVALIGFLFGILVLPIAINLGWKISVYSAAASVIGFALFAPLALKTIYFLSRFWSVLSLFGKYAAVGSLNVVLDLSILNFFIHLTNTANGWLYSVFVGIGFIGATFNSYFWNKFWTFQKGIVVNLKEFFHFALFSFIGFLINVATASFINNYIKPVGGLDPRLWANIAALLAIPVSFLFTFLGYRHIVFAEPSSSLPLKPPQP